MPDGNAPHTKATNPSPASPTPNVALESPKVLPDNRVTFRIYAPKASEVLLDGDWVLQGLGTGGPLLKDEQGVWSIKEYVEGDTVAEVLSYVAYEPARLLTGTRKEAERAVRRGQLSVAEANQFLQLYRAGMQGYTYLESVDGKGLGLSQSPEE